MAINLDDARLEKLSKDEIKEFIKLFNEKNKAEMTDVMLLKDVPEFSKDFIKEILEKPRSFTLNI